MEILKLDNITLSASFQDRDEAIKAAGRILVENGYVAPEALLNKSDFG